MRTITDADIVDGCYGGSLDLRGYTHPLPATLTSVGGSLDLEGYTHPLPAWIISAGKDGRDYWFAAVRTPDGWRVRAGCRDFTVEKALRYWGSGGRSDRPDCLTLVESLAREIASRNAALAAE